MTRRARKPRFIRSDSWKRKRIAGSGWRLPRGLHSKMRLRLRGHRARPSSGWRSPRAVRGLLRSGLRPCLVHNLGQLAALDPSKDAVIIAARLGKRKRAGILAAAAERKLTVANAGAAAAKASESIEAK